MAQNETSRDIVLMNNVFGGDSILNSEILSNHAIYLLVIKDYGDINTRCVSFFYTLASHEGNGCEID